MHDYPVHFPVLRDEAGASLSYWQVKGFPTILIVDAQGQVQKRITEGDETSLHKALQQIRLLAQ